jgi:hypothetical protein
MIPNPARLAANASIDAQNWAIQERGSLYGTCNPRPNSTRNAGIPNIPVAPLEPTLERRRAIEHAALMREQRIREETRRRQIDAGVPAWQAAPRPNTLLSRRARLWRLPQPMSVLAAPLAFRLFLQCLLGVCFGARGSGHDCART